MDSEPTAVSTSSSQVDSSKGFPQQRDLQGIEEEEPFSLNGPSIALLGLFIAIASIAIPLVAVFTERPLGRESIVPTALERDGFKPSSAISFTRSG